jgi:hypothetical protein
VSGVSDEPEIKVSVTLPCRRLGPKPVVLLLPSTMAMMASLLWNEVPKPKASL